MESPKGAEAHAEMTHLVLKSLLATKTLELRRQVSAFLNELSAPDELRSLDLDRGISLRDEVRRFEIGLIQLALKRSGGSQQRAARMLDLKPSTLNAKLKSYGILVEEMRA
jgi:transcriptional regulator with GAF, ATPase, and Fis domain